MRILIINNNDLEISVLKNVFEYLRTKEILEADSFQTASQILKNEEINLIISSFRMQDGSVIDFLEEIEIKDIRVIAISDYAEKNDIILSFRKGVDDFLIKPVDTRYLLKKIQTWQNSLSEEQPQEDVILKESEEFLGILGKSIMTVDGIGRVGFFSPEMKELREQAFKLHEFKDKSVLIQGETGTGKEIFARLVHCGISGKSSKNNPFVSINCSAISPSLFESELFGYEGGAFTGADPKGRKGKLELAGEGTIFLDEIADMPYEFQPKLLRVLQERSFYRISGTTEIPFKARVICATNHDVLKMVEDGKFRRDLYYRLNSSNLNIPPLRLRDKAIIPLTMMFMDELRPEGISKFTKITEEAKELLQNLSWKGNVRELQTAVEKIFFRFNDVYLQTAHIENVVDDCLEGRKSFFHLEISEQGIELDEVLRLFVVKILNMHNNNITRTAKFLNTTRNRVKRIVGLK